MTKKIPGPAKISTSVDTLTATVARAKRSSPTPHERKMAYCAAVPDGPGMMLLTAEDASRAIRERQSESPGVRTEYDAASTTRIANAITSARTMTPTLIDLIDSPTLWNSDSFGMIAANSSTTSAPG